MLRYFRHSLPILLPRLLLASQILLVAVVVLLPISSFASDAERRSSTWHSFIDWEEADIVISGTSDVDAAPPSALNRSIRSLHREVTNRFRHAIAAIELTSNSTGQTVLSQRPELSGYVDRGFDAGEADAGVPNRELSQVTVTWRFHLHETLTPIFQSHSIARPVRSEIEWTPTENFTGIVIDARGRLPVHGTGDSSRLTPVAYPSIYDTQLDAVVHPNMVEPEYLKRWGVVQYTDRTDLEVFRDRIGDSPLFVAADSAFGIVPANPVIPAEDSRRLLVGDHNRRLLSQGRIVIIVDSSSLIGEL